MTSRRLPLRTRQNRRAVFRRAVFAVVCGGLVLTLVVAGWFVSRIDAFSVDTIETRGLFSVSEGEVQAAAASVLDGSHFGFISRRFIPALPKTTLREAVSAIPRVEAVTVHREGTTLVLSITEAMPRALWCGSEEDSPCFFVNDEGVAYAPAPTLRGSAIMRLATPESPELGAEFLAASERQAVFRFADVLRTEHGLPIARIEQAGEYDIHFVLENGGRIMLSGAENFDIAYRNLISVLESEEFQHLQNGDFEYIDLRFNPKVFVQEDAPMAAALSATESEELATSTEDAPTPFVSPPQMIR